MNDIALDAATVDGVASGFAEVAADFADEVDGPPTLAEFIEVLGWAVPESDSVDGDFQEPWELTATLKDNKPYRSTEQSRVPDLNDDVFEDARSHTFDLAEQISGATGAPATPHQLASALLRVLKTGQVELADISGDDISDLAPAAAVKGLPKPTPGDVLAIPVETGGYRLAVLITRNRFGTALGLFDGTSPQPRPDAEVLRAPRKHPVHTEESRVKDGTWKVVDHDESLLGSFPAAPEIYHAPGAWPDLDFGKFGAAETADETLRLIDAEEAREIGLQDGSYRQTYSAAYLQQALSNEANGS